MWAKFWVFGWNDEAKKDLRILRFIFWRNILKFIRNGILRDFVRGMIFLVKVQKFWMFKWNDINLIKRKIF